MHNLIDCIGFNDYAVNTWITFVAYLEGHRISLLILCFFC